MTQQSNVRYLHFRRPTKNGSIEATGGYTVAYHIVSDNTIEYASAQCAKTDIYSKHLGRVKAAGRLNSDDHVRVFYGTERQFIDASTTELGRRNRYVRKFNPAKKPNRFGAGSIVGANSVDDTVGGL
jgi:hypothetical protein